MQLIIELMPPLQLIAPGSQITLAQLGLPESFTPARLRVPTRMFPAEKEGEYEPIKVREKKSTKPPQVENAPAAADVQMTDVNGEADGKEKEQEEDEIQYEEDPTSDDGAIYPIVEGRIVDWNCLFALLTHIHNTLSPPFHTPVLILGQSIWTLQDRENLTQFFFEKFKIPAFCIVDNALAISYAYASPNATVVDVGYGKCDVTTVSDHILNDLGKASAVPGCGGEAMTQRLLSLLSAKGFSRDMCEQLKKNPICEVLLPGTELPTENGPEEVVRNPVTAASIEQPDLGDGHPENIPAQGGTPIDPSAITKIGEPDQEKNDKPEEDDDGVLDVANIVASGKTSEFLAKKEREKVDKANKRKEAQIEAAVQKQAKLPNSKKAKVSFQYYERRSWEELNQSKPSPQEPPQPSEPQQNDAQPTEEEAATLAQKQERREERRQKREGAAFIRKDVDISLERFGAADGGILDRLASTIHRVIMSSPPAKRSDLWDSLIICGNGSKVRGFKEALFATLQARYLISPNSATIFTSEIPSAFSTPVATGANTPQPQLQQQHHHPSQHHPSGVNPLLHAATTASLAPPQQLQHFQQQHMQQSHAHSSHSQTPTSMKMLKPPEYFPEFKEHGMEEAAFLGAQVAARVLFVVDQGTSKGFLTRSEYNEVGPGGIHETTL